MVKKLFKHELKYYLRSLLPLYIVLASVAVLGRVIQCFEAQTTVYTIMRWSSVIMLVISCIAAIGLSLLFSVIRYYKNMFTGEGYLTLTLPVSASAHILVKLLGALIANLATLAAVVLAVCIFTLGPWLVELVKAGAFIYHELEEILEGNLLWYGLEMILLMLVGLWGSLLFYMMCISLGQLFRKNRALAAVGVYFGLYAITQILSTVFMVVTTLSGLWEAISNYLLSLSKQETFAMLHGWIWICFGLVLVFSAVYFLVSKYVLTKKLNLE